MEKLPFLGMWECAIDEKRRITLPARLRELLATYGSSPELIVTLGRKGSLMILPPAVWNSVSPDLFNAVVDSDAGAQAVRTMMAMHGNVSRLDNSGRLTLTEKQMKIALLDKVAIVFGYFNCIELWNPERFKTINTTASPEEHDRNIERYVGPASRRKERE